MFWLRDPVREREFRSAAVRQGAGASWPLGRGAQLVARGKNLTNKLVMAGIGGDGSVERATPRTLWIGLRLR
jgi:vitamin B12 transporter